MGEVTAEDNQALISACPDHSDGRHVFDEMGLCYGNTCKAKLQAATELRRLHAVEQELEALKQAISEAEPVAHIRKNGFRFLGEIEPQDDSETPLYTLKGIK